MRSRRWRSWVLAAGAACAIALPANAEPRATGSNSALGADGVGISVSAPASVGVGAAFDYTITLTYTGELTTASALYTITDALPSSLVYQAWGATPAGECPTKPADQQNGTVSCNVRFTPSAKTVTFTITVRSTQTGAVTNTVSLSNGDTASAATTIAPLPPGGSADVSVSGPDAITLSHTAAPPRFPYALTFTYSGPALASTARITFTDDLPSLVGSPGMDSPVGIFDCVYPDKTAPGGRISCTVEFTESRRTVTATVSVRPTGKTGVGTSTVSLSTGATASATTTFAYEQAPAPPEPPAPVAGPAAAPTKTAVETFTEADQAEAQQASVSSSAKTAQVALTWNDAGSSFDVTGIQLVTAGQAQAIDAAQLKITKKRTARTLDVRIKGLKRGTLRFRIVARKLGGKTRVVAKIRQSKRP